MILQEQYFDIFYKSVEMEIINQTLRLHSTRTANEAGKYMLHLLWIMKIYLTPANSDWRSTFKEKILEGNF